MKNNLTWENRYSKTDEPDKEGRWMSTCKFKNVSIGRVVLDPGFRYRAETYFPAHKGEIPLYNCTWSTPKQARESIEYYWEKFTRIITTD